MDLTTLNPVVLRELLELSERKSKLVEQIQAIDARITALSSGKAPAAAKRGRPGRKPAAAKAEKAPKPATGKKRGRPAKKSAGAPAAEKVAKEPKAAKAKAPRGKRGALKTDILKLLSTAGPEGISVKDISTKLGVKNQNVHVWFSTTGKKMDEIAKVGEARYALAPAASQTSAPATPAPAAAPVPGPVAPLGV